MKRFYTRKIPILSKPFKTKYGKMRSIVGYKRIFQTYRE
tara:strand:+ start:512 stop:628 length:117 start_codon:yes stop_codon:yes gene_type:complete